MISIFIGSTRLPRILLLGVIALNFGISQETDTFFLLYSIALFLIATVCYTSEVLAPGYKSFLLGTVFSVAILVGTFFFTNSLLSFLLIAYVISSTIASLCVGIVNREQNYKRLAISTLPYGIAIPIIYVLPTDIFVLTLALTLVECTRLVIVKSYIPEALNIKSKITANWKFAFLMITAVAIGGVVPVISKIFASNMSPGTITTLAYVFGVILPIANSLSYGVSIDKINRIADSISLVPSILAAIIISVGSLIFLQTDFWIKDIALYFTVFAFFIPLAVASSVQRSYFIKVKRSNEILISSILAVVVALIGFIVLFPFGIYGIFASIMVAQVVVLTYLTFKLKQQKYFRYHIDNKIVIMESR